MGWRAWVGPAARSICGLLALLCLSACERPAPPLLGTPAGPYRLTLTLSPAAPLPKAATTLSFALSHGTPPAPVSDLQVMHERRIHTFIVARDFTSFAHIHHEDFAPLTAADLAAGRFHFVYRFPTRGAYRVQSEFTHRERSWQKRFEVVVGSPLPPPSIPVDLARQQTVGDFQAQFAVSPELPLAGHEVELVITLSRLGLPVTDLQLLLGAEVHAAIWRLDGEDFSHAHSFTPQMAALMTRPHGAMPMAGHSAAMMLQMMSLPAQLVYPGPAVPLRHTFPSAGTYVIFLQLAPAGRPTVFRFMLNVQPDPGGPVPLLHSIVPST
ncbi:MAG: hypothetical protein EXR83_12450 [Gammaproteobacteria bacterium]|nr:hypothetical protein [Gammaproteobacteria bacterium]